MSAICVFIILMLGVNQAIPDVKAGDAMAALGDGVVIGMAVIFLWQRIIDWGADRAERRRIAALGAKMKD